MNNADDGSFSICLGGNFSNYLNYLVPHVAQFWKKSLCKEGNFSREASH